MIRSLLLITLIAFAVNTKAQNMDARLAKAVEKVYSQYKLFFDSSLLAKYVVLDKTKSYLVNAQTQKIKTLAQADDSFVFDEFSLTFAIVYKGDTIRRLPACRLDTQQHLMALGTPTNPVQHGDVLPPYQELVEGNIKFDYKKIGALLQKMKLETTAINLEKTVLNNTNNPKQAYSWAVTTSCPEIKCKQLQISACNGKILAEKIP